VAVVAFAAVGPAGSAFLNEQALAESGTATAEAERLAQALVAPPGCVAEPAVNGRRIFMCKGIQLGTRVQVFWGRSGPIALRAWRDASDPGVAEDAETAWHDFPGAQWRVVTTRTPNRMLAAALWLDGVPAPAGLTLRVRLARFTFAAGDHRVVLTEISAPDTDPAAAAALASLMEAQTGFPSPAS
jgi:hypothetical protein